MSKSMDVAFARFLGGRDAGRTSRCSVYCSGGVLYSFGEHYPLAVRMGEDRVAVNSDGYSNTTSKHRRGLLRHMVAAGLTEVPCDTPTMKKMAKVAMSGRVPETVDRLVVPADLGQASGVIRELCGRVGVKWVGAVSSSYARFEDAVKAAKVARELSG